MALLFGVPAASDKSIGDSGRWLTRNASKMSIILSIAVAFIPGNALLSMHVGWPKFGRFLTSIETPVDGGRTI